MKTGRQQRRLGQVIDLVRAHAHELVRELGRDLDSELINNRDLVLALVRDHGRDSAVVVVVRNRRLARDLARDLDHASIQADHGQRVAERVLPLAGRLLAAAARLLPAGDRARYAEEFRSELTEIACVGAGRRRQLAYAARVVMSARRLRADLRVPQRRGAAP